MAKRHELYVIINCIYNFPRSHSVLSPSLALPEKGRGSAHKPQLLCLSLVLNRKVILFLFNSIYIPYPQKIAKNPNDYMFNVLQRVLL